jgi:uncharacterized protein YcfJ
MQEPFMLKHLTAGAAALVMMSAMAAMPADARVHRHHHVETCRTGGTVAGAVVGGVLGNAITHHSAVGTVVGAGVGGLAGHRIARNNCGRHYSYHRARTAHRYGYYDRYGRYHRYS